MNDQEAQEYLEKALANPRKDMDIVHNGKVRILGLALQKALVKGPPIFYVALNANGHAKIYDLEYDAEGLLASCRKVARLKKVDPKDVGFNRVNGVEIIAALKSAGLTEPRKISASNFYDFEYSE